MVTLTEPRLSLDKWRLYDEIGYNVTHPEVRRFHDSTARCKVAVAPRRTTKSYSAAKDVLADLLQPNTRVWIVGPSYVLAEKEFRYIHTDLVLNRDKLGLPKPTVCLTNPKSGSLYIEWPWGAILEGKSADRPDGLLGEAVDTVVYSEAAQLPESIRSRYVKPTLITKKGREIIPTTPDGRGYWVYDEDERGRDPYNKEVEAFHWDYTANPTYDKEEYERAKKLYGEDSPVFREQYKGEWVFYTGMVYNMYSPETHVIEPFDIPSDWPRYRGIDFGHRDPFVVLWMAVSPNGSLYFYREYYTTDGLPIRQHATNIKNLSAGERIADTVADPEARQSIDDLNIEGVYCDTADNERGTGRMRVVEYMSCSTDNEPPENLKDQVFPSTQKFPKLFIFNTCKSLQEELKFYRWKEGVQKEGEKEKTEGKDHACDVMRYLCMTRPSPMHMRTVTQRNTFNWHLNQVKMAKSAAGNHRRR